MTRDEAVKLCATLVRRNRQGRVVLRAQVELHPLYQERYATADASWACRPKARVVFSGGRYGEHAIDLYASDAARVLAHWAGYCQASGMLCPAVGATVGFSSGSSPDGRRFGRVVRTGPKRALVAFKYKHGGASERWVSFDKVYFLVEFQSLS